ncbi:N-acetylglucosamine-6-phosphate deacetylase [Clostridium botulinum]|uniref:N-acetylglucosamine-6-phosphate deacetylase n=1 Tax=Clostridium botulinum TaxID=1491 RepID=A0A9Q1UYU7_CLOBO|nr:N-acetylglucosamine-6-phosphate deacetylase [Clostridium botulinum]AEB75326.1 N-acetylglucosamine-6-phosphate deacetylase [Clostridium botulinum BKT015925]KEI02313.1 N-acetylglucosamine-6-phosphate deacetylase [Clostridium botulinum D str. 16868]KEI04562.1 N-acetylglucosamine-6-phosphate deacetylase [Clostridium botulinum C/D str. Sp77]KLU75116.1 N-acetylglucosamine-6-phosphate deacetylase [Clostridium botulinum V891]KOA75089.1 N-acetylglucosamine-6-phosphate deacetylase [Clostridium botuli
MRCILNGTILTEDSLLKNKALIFDKTIIDIVDENSINKNDFSEIIDAKGNYISPGFIDIHIHGSGGKDVMDGDFNSLQTISKVIASKGTTSFLPTTMTMSKEKIYNSLTCIKSCMNKNLGGAKILGAHMEGPFINYKYKGAQNPDFILKPNFNFIKPFKDIIKIITLAPEEDKNFNFIKKIVNSTDIILSIGHSNATYEETIEAINLGIHHVTHTFNGMPPFHHRTPGIIGALFNCNNIKCEIIADTIHVHKGALKMLVNLKGKDNVILITDSMEAGCMHDGTWKLGGQKVIVKQNSARLESGSLAGSVLTLNTAIKNILDNTNLTLNEAVNLATLNPAKELKISNTKGSIDLNKDADLVIFNKNLDIKCTIVEGNIVFKN